MAELLNFKKKRRPRVIRRIREILYEADYTMDEIGCDSMVVIMSKGNNVEMFSYGKGVIHRSGLCDYARQVLMESITHG